MGKKIVGCAFCTEIFIPCPVILATEHGAPCLAGLHICEDCNMLQHEYSSKTFLKVNSVLKNPGVCAHKIYLNFVQEKNYGTGILVAFKETQ